MLSDSSLAQYRENGWIIPDYRVPQDLLADAQARTTAMMAARPDYKDLYPDIVGADIRFLEIAREPALLDILEQIIGPDIVMWTGALFGKPPGGGKATPWHQDGEYWPIRPLETVTVWAALDPSTTENGCLRILNGSHKARRLESHVTMPEGDYTLHQELDPAVVAAGEAVDLVLAPGQISIHDAFLAHGSEPNQSAQRRAGLTYRYMPASSHFDRDLAAQQHQDLGVPDISKRPLYLVRGDAARGRNVFDPIPAAV